MTQQSPLTEIDDEVGEIANMIAGSLRAEWEQDQLKITLPTVNVGNAPSGNNKPMQQQQIE